MLKKILTLGLLCSAPALAQSVRLPDVDCSRTPQNARCTFRGGANAGGSVGEGWPFLTGGLGESVGSGFVNAQENALYVPSEVGVQKDRLGGVVRVDLATGNRTLVSGALDATVSRGSGVAWNGPRGEKATLYELGRVRAVRPGPGGTIYALVDKGSTERTEVLQIDPKTGNRNIVWANKVADDGYDPVAEPRSIKALELKQGINEATLCERFKPSWSFETDGKNLYFFFEKEGLARVQPGGKCEWVSRYTASGDSVTGSGPSFGTFMGYWTVMQGQNVAVVGGPSIDALVSFDTRTGERRFISRHDNVPAKRIGKNDVFVGYSGAPAFNGKVFATTGYVGFESPFLTIIDPKTGDRTAIEDWKGSLSGSAGGRSSEMQVVAALPGRDEFILYYNGALHVANPKTGNSYVLSQ
ncbi:hypothetical protein [Deinococcus radiodurans]|jgi:hypothetical protein|uniref:Uncharacterized protein n=1 Tax=Deinococcus radiodurans (strain ATCC 13939 / DSM 20539 / JCM 16871 / CCUG 27074 / LMG 4051 / NBRC 15346 / NCIMB 9279 / VKM B-1422 / R1) TaxID=243230 RepID=Q9RWE3_DEIRA|nr:hypothetical protein [Deinococcus radiodurans]AAF10305.1 hypothetical protein DR_0726 [Deinococcus radiodurans R1 = ATCC 13939 = DSM 20539]ANC72054.1 hypothetical protein A2G07_09870 [Deinococcus radiodurans R1 = ATCC 13939 = DSM 20539]QEM72665.1 hypothetical protein DXG80_13390 [Deinococcus radiodurans]QIP28870.1 hypothetical protein HAV23_06545 [Deinococcus radiodurans]QIP32423.1 hypothetical protein HAV35_10245 [Deinococcus radiodurans]